MFVCPFPLEFKKQHWHFSSWYCEIWHVFCFQVGNLGLLFMLLFFIYAALGVELFGKLGQLHSCCKNTHRHTHTGVLVVKLFITTAVTTEMSPPELPLMSPHWLLPSVSPISPWFHHSLASECYFLATKDRICMITFIYMLSPEWAAFIQLIFSERIIKKASGKT